MRRLISLALMLSVLIFPASQQPQASAQTPTNQDVEAVFAQMDAASRVGQLFLVTYYGSDVGPESDIVQLIDSYHVGGVILTESANNFVQESDLGVQMYDLTTALQLANTGTLPVDAADTTETPPDEPTPAAPTTVPARPGYVPLFVGLEYAGDGWPYVLPNTDLSPLPTSMAIGASWNRAYAAAAGRVVGSELSTVGVNLLLGPSVDVLETPQPLAIGDLGTRVFGGEPYWVSEMATAYVSGLHEGSSGRLAVVPGRFPGYGGADRPSTIEIPTVRRSRDQLTQSDLRPFVALTAIGADPAVVADGVFVGHIRYQGFQADNLRVATPPISLGAGALQSLLASEPFAAWQQNGGIVISDSLGVRGVRRFYDPEEIVFPARRIASEAFSAGNDMLYLGEFGTDPEVNQAETIADTIEYFVQRYQEDAAFREQVDESVRRILRAKLRLYGTFEPASVLPARQGLQTLGQGENVTLDVARSSLTMLFPDQPDQVTVPQRGDQIVIFTDTRTSQRCATCVAQPIVSETALRDAILHAYGPTATGLVAPADVMSFSFDELDAYLRFGPLTVQSGDETPEPDLLPIALDSADWVVFLMHDLDPAVPSSDVVKRFLAQPLANPDARLAVMAMGAPYYLDSTEVSKLTVLYGLYGYTEPFIDVAARALFQEFSPTGAPPVSVSALNYDIFRATSADPAQVISLAYAIEGAGEAAETPEEGRAQLGDTLLLTTEVIEDWNDNPVPDGTPVEFIQSYANETPRITQTVTLDGIAEATVVLDRQGELRITVVSGEARNSETLRLVVAESGSAEIDVLPADILPTAAPTPTETPEPEETPETAPTATAEPPEVEPPITVPSVGFSDLFLALMGLAGIAAVVFALGFTRRDLNFGLLMALPTLIGGLIGYNYYALMLPGTVGWRDTFQGWSAGIAAWLGAALGLGTVVLAVYLWRRWTAMGLPNRNHR